MWKTFITDNREKCILGDRQGELSILKDRQWEDKMGTIKYRDRHKEMAIPKDKQSGLYIYIR